jgi:ferric-dicitrate binding protein FerR (iron transport regulator)
MTHSREKRDILDEQQLERILKKAGPRPLPPKEVTQEIRSAVHATWREEVAISRRTKKTRWLAVAASVAIVVAAGLFQFQEETPESIASVDGSINSVEIVANGGWEVLTGESLAGTSRVRTGDNAYLSLTLATGMNIRLDQNTEVSLNGTDTLDLKKGSVYVDSYGHRPGTGFVVNTEFGSANDIGTQFAVSAHEDGWNIQVREGAVLVHDDGINTQLELGDRLTISANDVMTATNVEPDDASWKWVENVSPQFDIEGQSLNDYLDWMSRETGRKVGFRTELARSAAKRTILHGSIEGLLPGESLSVVLSTTELGVVDDNSESILIDKLTSN